MAFAIHKYCYFSILSFILGVSSGQAKGGFILTVPSLLRHGTSAEYCLTLYNGEHDGDNTGERYVALTFFHVHTGEQAMKVESLYPVGQQTCKNFLVPEPGRYEMLLSNGTDLLHDSVLVGVLENKLMTLVQTDKPQYKPGQEVKFRILTILSDMKPRTGKIKSVYVMDPSDSRVKQYLDVPSQGIASLAFQLGREAKLGQWKIEVNLDEAEEDNGRGTLGYFSVEEYVLPRFEVEIHPPPFILTTDETISGKVCGKYTYGKPVSGFLALDVCWTLKYRGPSQPCHHEDVRLDENGCYNFTVNATEIKEGMDNYHYMFYSAELEVRAKVTEDGTGATVSQNHTGPSEAKTALTIMVDDYSNGFFKPGLPYYGKVSVTRPDGSAAAGEVITVMAEDYDNLLRFSRNFTTDGEGRAMFSLCGGFTLNTTSISINAKSAKYPEPPPGPPGPRGRRESPQGYRRVLQWFSPSLSYLQLPRPDGSHTCGERLTLSVPFTALAGATPQFQYQVIARGTVIKSGQVSQAETTPPGTRVTMPPAYMCLQPEDYPQPPQPEDEMPEDTNYGDMGADEIEPRFAPDDQPQQPGGFEEPAIRSADSSDTVSSFFLDVSIEPIMSPKFTLLVYHVMADGEVVADGMQYDVEPCFQNQVRMEFNTSQALPGESVGVKLSAAPGSVCGVGVVDKSVNILGGDHQVTPSKIFDMINEFSGRNHIMSYRHEYEYCEERFKNLEGDAAPESDDTYWRYTSRYVDAIQAFKSSGVIVMTDLNLQTRPCRQSYPVFYVASLRTGARNRVPAEKGDDDAKKEDDHNSSVRSNFPETWLWDFVVVGPTGEALLEETAADTVTTWAGNAVCVNKEDGFGLSEMTSLTTFQAFFLSVHLPYAAVRGERLPIMLTVYNYLEKCITVKLTLDLGEAFKVHNSYQYRKPICVCGGKSSTAKFYATPEQIGHLPIVAKATIVSGQCKQSVDIDLDYVGLSDQVNRSMLVKAEGAEQSYTHASYLCPKDGQTLEESIQLELPAGKELVRDSARGEVQVIGDIMGPALSNLDSLVRMPTGCGEQNMVGFVPNILVLNYLSSTGNLDKKTTEAAIKNMEHGYQRELNYRHRDGSFSAFGKNDPAGSVWLTAFVVKSFAQAQEHIYIDKEDLEKSVSFLRRTQLENGCYRETGRVLSSYMMGGLGRRRREGDTALAALTAYVLVALMEAGVDTSTPTIVSGMKCMNQQFRARQRKMDVYSLALVTYANTRYNAGSREAQVAFRALRAKAKRDETSVYWSRGKLQPPATNTWFYAAAPSAEVEMTSYALMSFLRFHKKRAVEMSHKIAMWLTRQRNSRGGFASTQDTVVGLDALTQFASLAYSSEPTELQVRVTSSAGAEVKETTFNISDSQGGNKLLLQTTSIASLPGTVNISIAGVGCALVQLNVRYNKPTRAFLSGQKPKFYLKVAARPYQHDKDRCDRRTIHVTVSSRRGHKFSKGMGMVTMKMITSWTPVASSLTKLKSMFPTLGMKRFEHEEEEGLLSFYFDEFTRKSKTFTVDVEQDRDLKVSRPKPAEVRVFEYYETDVTNVQSYNIRTTCGTKLEIPRFRPAPPVPGTQVRQDDLPSVGRLQQRRVTNAGRPSRGCPVCHTTRKIPDDFAARVCNASAVYKALSGRKGARPLKLRQDLRPTKKQSNIGRFASYDIDPRCTCSLLSTNGGAKRVIILVQKKVTRKLLTLDGTSLVMRTSRKAEKQVRAAQQTCPLVE